MPVVAASPVIAAQLLNLPLFFSWTASKIHPGESQRLHSRLRASYSRPHTMRELLTQCSQWGAEWCWWMKERADEGIVSISVQMKGMIQGFPQDYLRLRWASVPLRGVWKNILYFLQLNASILCTLTTKLRASTTFHWPNWTE